MDSDDLYFALGLLVGNFVGWSIFRDWGFGLIVGIISAILFLLIKMGVNYAGNP